MGKSREEDRIEKIIRGLLKLTANRGCINCNSLGPQYVCTTFWTFVCTNCSGVHREFTHRVKSVSMATFSMEDVNALQAGGNEKARQIYFRTWDRHRNFFPDNSNIHALRDFIKQVYVERRYTGESHPALVPSSRYGDKDESYERRRADSSESSTSRARSIDRYSRYSNDEVRSPGYPRENSRYGGQRASSSHFDGTGGRYKVDENRIAGRSATQMFTTEDITPRRRSPDRHWSRDTNSAPVRNTREFLGEKILALRFSDQPKSSDRRIARNAQQVGKQSGQSSPVDHKTTHRRSVSANVQNTVQSGSELSARNDALKPKSGSAGSLIDLSPSPSPDDASIQKQPPQENVTNDGKYSTSSEPVVKEKACSVPPKNTLEFLLFELYTPAELTPSDHSEVPNDDNAASTAHLSNSLTSDHVSAQCASSEDDQMSSSAMLHLQGPDSVTSESSTLELALFLPDGSAESAHTASAEELASTCSASTAASTTFNTASTGMLQSSDDAYEATRLQMVPYFLDDGISSTREADNQQSPSTQQPVHSSTFVSDGSSTAQQTSPLNGVANYQPTNLLLAPSAEVACGTSIEQSSQPAVGPMQETMSKAEMQPSPADARSSGRTELPADFFASLYPSRPMPALGWQMGPSYGMGFNMQYHPYPMQIPAYSNLAPSTNPFDTSDNAAQHHYPTFPSMAAQQGGLPNVSAPSSILRSSSYGSDLQSFEPFQSPSYQSGAYMGQYASNNMPPSSLQEVGGFVQGGTAGSFHSNQQIPYRHPAPTNQNSFPTGGGNPFG